METNAGQTYQAFTPQPAPAWQRAFSRRARAACGGAPTQTLQPVACCAV